MMVCFKRLAGILLLSIDLVQRIASGAASSFLHSLSRFAGILSGPGAEFELMRLIA